MSTRGQQRRRTASWIALVFAVLGCVKTQDARADFNSIFDAELRVVGTPFNIANLEVDLYMTWTGSGEPPSITSVDVLAQILNTQSERVARFAADSDKRVRLNSGFWGTEGMERDGIAAPLGFATRSATDVADAVTTLVSQQPYKIATLFVDASELQADDQFTVRLLSEDIDSESALFSVFGAYANATTLDGAQTLSASSTIRIVATPEPATLGLLGVGGAVIVRLRNLRLRKQRLQKLRKRKTEMR